MRTYFNLEAVSTKNGIPCLWENGGGYSNTGKSQIITDSNCAPKKAIYVKTRGSLACSEHALIPIAIGDYVIHVDHHRFDFYIKIMCINNILRKMTGGYIAKGEVIAEFSDGEWDTSISNEMEAAVEAAKNKATEYHCREAKFVK